MLKSKSILLDGYKTQTNDNRGHEVQTDLTSDLNGHDTGTSPLELVVLGFSSCTVTLFKLIADKMRVPIEYISADVEAEKPDPMGTIISLLTIVTVKSEASPEKLERILERVIKSCPVGTIFEKANIPNKMILKILD